MGFNFRVDDSFKSFVIISSYLWIINFSDSGIRQFLKMYKIIETD